MAAKKVKKAVTKKAAPKKAASKKAATKKKAKKAIPKKAAPATRSAISRSAAPAEEMEGIPCICRKVNGKWFCMKLEDGGLVQCDGPFATKSACEQHRCF